MKKLFLSSVAAYTLDKIYELLPDKPDKLKLAFIPTAADTYKNKPWFYEDRDKLIEMGFKVKDVDIKNKTEKELTEELKNIDVIFVSGGNTFYLLEKTLESGFDKVLKKLIHKGIVYIGSSAGSVLLCPTIEVIKELDDPKAAPKLKSYKGLGIVDFLILPHFGDEKYKQKYKTIINEWKDRGYELKLLTNNQAIIVNGNSYKIVEVELN